MATLVHLYTKYSGEVTNTAEEIARRLLDLSPADLAKLAQAIQSEISPVILSEMRGNVSALRTIEKEINKNTQDAAKTELPSLHQKSPLNTRRLCDFYSLAVSKADRANDAHLRLAALSLKQEQDLIRLTDAVTYFAAKAAEDLTLDWALEQIMRYAPDR